MDNQPKTISEARKIYTVEMVIDAIQSGDWPAIADAARMFPALVTGLLGDPVALIRSVWGKKSANVVEHRLKDLVYVLRGGNPPKNPFVKQVMSAKEPLEDENRTQVAKEPGVASLLRELNVATEDDES